jgi:hypothetical protein
MGGGSRAMVTGAVAAGLVVLGGMILLPEPPGRRGFPTAGPLAELTPYLEPVDADAVRVEARGVPATVVVRGDPFRPPPAAVRPGGDGGAVSTVASPPRPRWTLSAVMVSGDRRIAIINDEVAREGERLRDGSLVRRVANDHVILVTPAGESRRLELER